MTTAAFSVTGVNAGPEPYDIDAEDSDGNTIRIRVQHAPYPPVEVGSTVTVEWQDASPPVVEGAPKPDEE